jgi:hypothetical protein
MMHSRFIEKDPKAEKYVKDKLKQAELGMPQK